MTLKLRFLPLLMASLAAQAAEVPADQAESLNDVRFVVGGVLANGPIYFGQRERRTGLRPMFALRWGKVRLSSSGAGSLIGEANAGGASADLFRTERMSLRVGVRIDRGRRVENDASNRLEDLPRVRGTLRGRVALNLALDLDSSLSLTTAPDLLGRKGGTLIALGYYSLLPALDDWIGVVGQWSLAAGLTAGDDQYMQSYFGIAPGAQRFAPYEAKGGLRNANLGLGWRRAYGNKGQWVVFGGAHLQRLLGSAAKAPFVEKRSTWTADLGLAYRY